MSPRTALTSRHATNEVTLAVEAPQPIDLSALSYTYSEIDEEHWQTTMMAAIFIRSRQRRVVEDLIGIGQTLQSIRALLPHGQFILWAEKEFGYRKQATYELIHIAERFGDKSPIIGLLTDTTARMLAAPSVPDAVIDAVVEATHEKGAPLLVREVKDIKQSMTPHKPPLRTIDVTPTRPQAPRRAITEPSRVVYLQPEERLTAELERAEYGMVINPETEDDTWSAGAVGLDRDWTEEEFDAYAAAHEVTLPPHPISASGLPDPYVSASGLPIPQMPTRAGSQTAQERLVEVMELRELAALLRAKAGRIAEITGKHVRLPGLRRELDPMIDDLDSLIATLGKPHGDTDSTT